jgi:hypothetical protein
VIALTHAYGFSREPFAQDIPLQHLYPCRVWMPSASASTTRWLKVSPP